MKRVLVTEPIHPNGMAILEACPDIEIVRIDDTDPSTLIKAVKDVEGIVVRTAIFTTEILQAATKLEVISRHGVGCDNIDVAHLSARGVPVAIASGANARSVAEHTLGFMISTARELTAQNDLVKSGRWADRNNFRAVDLHGSKIVILGFGRVGRKVAPLCKAFGMDVVVVAVAALLTVVTDIVVIQHRDIFCTRRIFNDIVCYDKTVTVVIFVDVLPTQLVLLFTATTHRDEITASGDTRVLRGMPIALFFALRHILLRVDKKCHGQHVFQHGCVHLVRPRPQTVSAA